MNPDFNNLPENRQSQLMAFNRLLTIMDELREQCPWDKRQTIDSLRHLTIEETYELSDAIIDRKSTRLNSSHVSQSRMPSSA